MGKEIGSEIRSGLKRIFPDHALSLNTTRRIEREAKRLNFERGQEILARSEELNDVFFLIGGAARVIVYSASGKAVNFRRLEVGDLFGEFAAIDGLSRSASVEAVESCQALSINPTLFRELMETDPAFMELVLTHLVRLLRSLTSRIIEFSTLAVTSRIHTELLRMARAAPGDNVVRDISPAPTHWEIAGRISTHREAVSREISRLKQLGIIERRGRSLIITDVRLLERMVEDASGEQ